MKLSDSFAVLAQHFRWAVLVVLLVQPVSALSATRWSWVYVYEKSDGSYLMTSSRLQKTRHQLVKTYKTPKTSKSSRVATRSKRKRRSSSCRSDTMRVRAEKYKRSIEVYSRIYGVDESLVHSIIKNESCFRAKAKSPVGAIGLMQLMPGTAKEMLISNPWDPEQNIQGGVKYIAEMLREFNDDLRLAVAAYNAGPGNVRKYKGIPPFRETRAYVKRVMADYHRGVPQYAKLSTQDGLARAATLFQR